MIEEQRIAVEAAPLFTPEGIRTAIWVIGLSVAGGVANYLRKRKNGERRLVNRKAFLIDIFVSAFVGVVTYLLCRSWTLDQYLTAALVGITSHMGSRAIFLFEQLVANRVPGATVPPDDTHPGMKR